MAIQVNCPGCGKGYTLKDELAGRSAKCNGCGSRFQIPAASGASPAAAATGSPPPGGSAPPPPTPQEAYGQPPAAAAPGPAPPQAQPPQAPPVAGVAAAAGGPPPVPGGPPAPAAPTGYAAPGGLNRMNCQSCGGLIEYSSGQGYFECKYCGSRYNAAMDGAGGSIIQTIELRELKEEMRGVRGEMSLSRLQEKAGNVQDKIDFRYVEFFHSWPRKAGSIGIVLVIVGVVLAFIGLANIKEAAGVLLLGLAAAGGGVALFLLVYKKAEAAFRAESEMMKAQDLEPVYQQIRQVGGTLEGGEPSLGYTESTRTPLRYCVSCHQNVTPEKGKGGGLGGGFHGMNLALTFLTCGMWLPAWFMMTILGNVGGMAGRAMAKGCCPQCRTTPMFPARIKNV